MQPQGVVEEIIENEAVSNETTTYSETEKSNLPVSQVRNVSASSPTKIEGTITEHAIENFTENGDLSELTENESENNAELEVGNMKTDIVPSKTYKNAPCHIKGELTPGINDFRYLVEIYDPFFNNVVENKEVGVNDGKFELTSNYSEPRKAYFISISQDLKGRSDNFTIVLMPGEQCELKVKKYGCDISGSTFYRQYSNAKDLIENAMQYNSRNARDEAIRNYLLNHKDEEGCVYYYMANNDFPKGEILRNIDFPAKFIKPLESSRFGGIKLATQVQPQSDHFTRVDGIVSQGISDIGYVIKIYDADFENIAETQKVYAKNNEYTVYFDYEEPRLAVFTAIFPDSSICNSTVPILIVPGEHAKLKVKNGTFILSGGSTFYKQYGLARDAYENMDEKGSVNYLKEHGNEAGCVMAFIYRPRLPRKTILKHTSDEVKNGQFHRLFETKHYGPYFTKEY